MFFSLYKKECFQYFKSITYVLILIGLLFFYFTQVSEFKVFNEPQPGQTDYFEWGLTYSEDPNEIMQKTLEKLSINFSNNSYTAYPFGFYKHVILNEKEQNRIEEILVELMTMTKEEAEKLKDENLYEQGTIYYDSTGIPHKQENEQLTFTIRTEVSYEQFLSRMEEVDDMIGGGSDYAKDEVRKNATRSFTYEEAKEEYDAILQKDRLSNAYARLFCDYLGIMLSILPVFLAAARCFKDQRSMAQEVIYSRKVSSGNIIASRYLAAVTVILIPVVLLGCFVTLQCFYYGSSLKVSVDLFAFFKHILGWLLPGILVSLSMGFFFTELTGSMIGILIQGVWWFLSVFTGDPSGSVGRCLVPRFNRLGGYYKFKQLLPSLIVNRIGYTILAFVLLAGSIVVVEAKRKGAFLRHGTIFLHRKDSSQV